MKNVLDRLVRDLSAWQGDHPGFRRGGRPELDKTVIDEISEPLLHLIRNAVDPRLEKPLGGPDRASPGPVF